MASVLSLALSMEFGFTLVGVLAALGYAIAWICLQGDEAPIGAQNLDDPSRVVGATISDNPTQGHRASSV